MQKFFYFPLQGNDVVNEEASISQLQYVDELYLALCMGSHHLDQKKTLHDLWQVSTIILHNSW